MGDLRDDLAAAIGRATTHAQCPPDCDHRPGSRDYVSADAVLAVLAGREAAAVAAVTNADWLIENGFAEEPPGHAEAFADRLHRALDGAGDTGMPNMSGPGAAADKSGMDGAGDEPRPLRGVCSHHVEAADGPWVCGPCSDLRRALDDAKGRPAEPAGDEPPTTEVRPAPLEGVVTTAEPTCRAHPVSGGHWGSGLRPAHTWGSGWASAASTATGYCQRCPAPIVIGDRYVCVPGGIAHLTCPTGDEPPTGRRLSCFCGTPTRAGVHRAQECVQWATRPGPEPLTEPRACNTCGSWHAAYIGGCPERSR